MTTGMFVDGCLLLGATLRRGLSASHGPVAGARTAQGPLLQPPRSPEP